MMLRLLGLESRTARSSIYSEKAEIKSPRELLGGPSPGAAPCTTSSSRRSGPTPGPARLCTFACFKSLCWSVRSHSVWHRSIPPS